MLELKDIKKEYVSGETKVLALKGVSLAFRKSEFVAILGPSGCGKTTMLNIVGGLDRYSEGDLIIEGRSTKDFKPYDWDAYRNNHVGFVFQSYNLIPHQTVLGNVELALTLTGVSKAVRRERAKEALERVGLADQLHKRSNQLSGGQMQRVAIARAIVNNPSIILADEPTGALDSKTSVQVMEILKEIASDRLIIMVTHNDEIARTYATRTIKLLDGEVVSDSRSYEPTEQEIEQARNIAKGEPDIKIEEKEINKEEYKDKNAKKEAKKQLKLQKKAIKQRQKERKRNLDKTSMSFFTALSLSGRNLATKKGRTFMISLAGSIGIIGIALVLAIQNGFTGYIVKMQADMLSTVPIQIEQQFMDIEALLESGGPQQEEGVELFPEGDTITVHTPKEVVPYHFNYIDKDYVDYVLAFDPQKTIDVVLNYKIEPNLIRVDGGEIQRVDTSLVDEGRASWQEMIKNMDFIDSQYDLLHGATKTSKFPQFVQNAEYQEVALVVDNTNRINNKTLERLGINLKNSNYKVDDFLGLEYRLLNNDNYYNYDVDSGKFTEKDDDELMQAYNNLTEKDFKIKIVGVLRVKEDAPSALYNTGLVYPQQLTQAIIQANKDTLLVQKQRLENEKGFSGKILTPTSKDAGKDYATIIANQFAGALTTADGEAMSAGELVPILKMFDDIKENKEYYVGVFMQMNPSMSEAEVRAMLDAFLQNEQILSVYLYHASTNAINLCGGAELPVSITIYPLDFDTKAELTAYLDAYNEGKSDTKIIRYMDTIAIIGSTLNNLVNIISYVLIAFAAISLVVSSIMIAIITYVSVIERTKEIGVLRSIGARKKDITRVFNAETAIIGFIAGFLGVVVSYLLTVPINFIIKMAIQNSNNGFTLRTNLASLSPIAALALIAISVVLTLIAGLIPAFIAAKKDPVVALRTE